MTATVFTGWLDKLALLTRQDRDWILTNLSSNAKDRLRRHATLAAAEDIGETMVQDETGERDLDMLDATEVAGYLAEEPSWVIAMVLSVRAWRWEAQVLAKAAPVKRLEVTQLRASLPRITATMRVQLVRTLGRRLLREQRTGTRFEDLLAGAQQVRARL